MGSLPSFVDPDQVGGGEAAALEPVGAVGVELGAGDVEGEGDVLAQPVARLADGLGDRLEGGLVRREARGEPALVADGGGRLAALEERLERGVDLGAAAEALGERRGADRRDHELLDVEAVVGVGAAVQHVQHRDRQAPGLHPEPLAEEAVERGLRGRGGGVGGRERDGQDRVGAQPAEVGGAVGGAQGGVEPGEVGGVAAADRSGERPAHVFDGLPHALPAEPRPAVAQLAGLVGAGGGAARHRGAAAAAVGEDDVGFEGRVAAGVEDLAVGDGGEGRGGHGPREPSRRRGESPRRNGRNRRAFRARTVGGTRCGPRDAGRNGPRGPGSRSGRATRAGREGVMTTEHDGGGGCEGRRGPRRVRRRALGAWAAGAVLAAAAFAVADDRYAVSDDPSVLDLERAWRAMVLPPEVEPAGAVTFRRTERRATRSPRRRTRGVDAAGVYGTGSGALRHRGRRDGDRARRRRRPRRERERRLLHVPVHGVRCVVFPRLVLEAEDGACETWRIRYHGSETATVERLGAGDALTFRDDYFVTWHRDVVNTDGVAGEFDGTRRSSRTSRSACSWWTGAWSARGRGSRSRRRPR
jgi:hypothetical protein